MEKPWEKFKAISVSDIALLAHELWPVPEPFRLEPISFYASGEMTEETKETVAREIARGMIRGESPDVVSDRISREIKRQIDDYFRRMNNMLHHGTYEDATDTGGRDD